eukprot:6210542-Pleurochrysis_carterae.AAC.3
MRGIRLEALSCCVQTDWRACTPGRNGFAGSDACGLGSIQLHAGLLPALLWALGAAWSKSIHEAMDTAGEPLSSAALHSSRGSQTKTIKGALGSPPRRTVQSTNF